MGINLLVLFYLTDVSTKYMSLMMRYWTEEYFLININEAGPWTGSVLKLHLNPGFLFIKILMDTDEKPHGMNLQ